MKYVKGILPHLLFILAGIFIVFLILDEYNPTMDFVNNAVSIKLFWSFCILTIINSVLHFTDSRKRADDPKE